MKTFRRTLVTTVAVELPCQVVMAPYPFQLGEPVVQLDSAYLAEGKDSGCPRWLSTLGATWKRRFVSPLRRSAYGRNRWSPRRTTVCGKADRPGSPRSAPATPKPRRVTAP